VDDYQGLIRTIDGHYVGLCLSTGEISAGGWLLVGQDGNCRVRVALDNPAGVAFLFSLPASNDHVVISHTAIRARVVAPLFLLVPAAYVCAR
jgi:hypothetical protein